MAATDVQTPPTEPEAAALPDYLTDANAVLKDEGVKWRYGRPPDYSKTRKVYAESKCRPVSRNPGGSTCHHFLGSDHYPPCITKTIDRSSFCLATWEPRVFVFFASCNLHVRKAALHRMYSPLHGTISTRLSPLPSMSACSKTHFPAHFHAHSIRLTLCHFKPTTPPCLLSKLACMTTPCQVNQD